MKKIIFFIGCFLLAIFNVAANGKETIYAGEKIANMYIRKIDSNGNITNKQGQFIRRSSDDEVVYCLEPFIGLIDGFNYESVSNNYWEYLNIDKNIWEEILLIAYYGYMYENHTDDYWYYITQVLIWRTIDENAQFYFLESIDGEVNNNLYSEEISEITNLVKKHHQTPDINDIKVLYGDNIKIYDNNEVLNKYKVIDNDMISIKENYININANQIGEYNINLYKENNNYKNIPLIYYDEVSQKLLKVGNIEPNYYSFSVNIIPGEIKIIKKDYDTQEVILQEGIKFLLFDESNNLIKEEYTNAEGIVTFNNLKKGKYFIKEASDQIIKGYEINSEVIEINVDSKEAIVIDFYNKKSKGKIKITKYIEIFDNAIKEIAGENIRFGLYDSKNNLISIKETNNNGIIIFDDLDIGKYIVKELDNKEEYIKNNNYEIEIKLIDNKASEEELLITNELKKGNIIINKYNAELKPLSDTEFNIYNDNYFITLATNELGVIEIKDLPLGDYYIKEIKASDGYQILKDIIPISIKSNAETITVNIINKKISIKIPNTSIKIDKIIMYFKRKKW